MLLDLVAHIVGVVVPNLVDNQHIRVHGVEHPALGLLGLAAVEQTIVLHVPGGDADVGGILAGQRQARRGDAPGREGVDDAAGAGRHVARIDVPQDEPDIVPAEQVLPAGRHRVPAQGHLELGVADRWAHLQTDVVVRNGSVGAADLEGALFPAELPHQLGADAVEIRAGPGVHVGVEIEPHVLLLVGLDLAPGFEPDE